MLLRTSSEIILCQPVKEVAVDFDLISIFAKISKRRIGTMAVDVGYSGKILIKNNFLCLPS